MAKKISEEKSSKEFSYGRDTKQYCRLSICEYWLSFTNTVSEAKIQITLLILRRGALSNGHGHGRSVKELQRNAFDEEGQVLRRVGNRGSLLFTNTW